MEGDEYESKGFGDRRSFDHAYFFRVWVLRVDDCWRWTSQRSPADTMCSYNNSLDNNTNQRLPAQEQLRLSMK
jgi:hypothetical protein